MTRLEMLREMSIAEAADFLYESFVSDQVKMLLGAQATLDAKEQLAQWLDS